MTDCGNNLGFELDKVCKAECNGKPITNHTTIVDTEYAAFYHKDRIHEKDWELLRSDDTNLSKSIIKNIEELIYR